MKISKHRLVCPNGEPVAFEASKNRSGKFGTGDLRYLVMHYTANTSASGAVSWLCDPGAKASAHLVIDRDGRITQLVPFEAVAWHAGRSRWHGLTGLNHHSIGIELVNGGLLEGGPGRWRTWAKTAIPDDEVVFAVHKHGSVEQAWHDFPPEQIDAALLAAQAVVDAYDLWDVLGHDDVAPGRKQDPGPAFPIHAFRSAVMGRSQDAPAVFQTTTRLNMREGPGTDFAKVKPEALAKGQRLHVHAYDCSWCSVELLDEADQPVATGWVHGDYIRPV